MLSSSRSIRPRSLHRPTAWALAHISKPSLLELHSSSNVQRLYRRSNPKIPSRRYFSWGRRRQWGYSSSPSIYKWFESCSRASRDGRGSSLHYNYFNDPRHSIYRYLSGHGWRMSNYWGRSGSGMGCFSQPSKSDNSNEEKDHWSKSYQETKAVLEKEFEEFKRMVDADPCGMLFGREAPRRATDDGKNTNSNHKDESSPMKSKQRDDKSYSTAKPVDKVGVQQRASQPLSPGSEKKAPPRQEPEIEEYEFDPITMRKVPKRSARPASAPVHEKAQPDSEFVIPVKPFVATGPSPVGRSALHDGPSRNEVLRKNQTDRNRLVQEGLGASSPGLDRFGSKPQQPSENIRSAYSKPETALDRHLRTKRTQAEESSTKRPPLKFKDDERTTEDVESLRAIDVRASAGLGRLPKETNDDEKKERRKKLDNDYERRPQYLDARLRDEIASQKAQASRGQSYEKRSPFLSHTHHPEPNRTHAVDSNSNCEQSALSQAGSEQRSEQLAEISRREAINLKKAAAKNVHEEEVKVQKAAMEALEMRHGNVEKTGKDSPVHSQECGEGDISSNVTDFVGRGRWYKQRAPHAMKESELKLKQLAKDRAFVREIRSIYENEYGTIDTRHRQPSKQTEQEAKERTQEAAIKFSKQSPRQVEQKDSKEHKQQALTQPSGQSSSSTLPECSPRVSPEASKTDLSSEKLPHKPFKVNTVESQLPHVPSQVEPKQNEHAQKVIKVSEESSTRTLSNPSDASSGPRSSTKLQHAQNRELETPDVPKEISNIFNESGVELPTVADKGITKSASPTTTASLSPDKSGSSTIPKPIPPEASDSTKPSSYRILAYDPSTQRVTSAKTTSQTAPADEKSITLVEALSRLATPAKFLPHFASLQNSGYEIVAGSTNILIFKKVRPAKPASPVADESSTAAVDEKYPLHTNPIDGTTTQTGNFASPTGFVNHDAILPPSEDSQPMPPFPWSTKPNDKITRQEAVFSGSRHRWAEDHGAEHISRRLRNKQRRSERRKRTLKRMVWVGIWVAGCCYTVGVGTEFLRAA
ncbi:hypothetical protein MMC07_008038 [Pseudocyphellaria aurata]|nr:hypothetical protein [Pseudocyphellaria aurata]